MLDNDLPEIDWDKMTFSYQRRPIGCMSFTVNKAKNGSPGKCKIFGDISLSPAAGVLNYGQGLFEE